ncbi:MAG: RNA-binding domain-containing protein [Candidatus Zixiibacteriota bacterium]
MDQIRISAKDVGVVALPSFCPRCLWIKMHCNYRLPFQIFPGIFSSIDLYSRRITHVHYEQRNRLPDWIAGVVTEAEPVKVPHYSKFSALDDDTNTLVTGVPDEIFRKADGSYFIVDYKTAKFTATQDALMPLYETQLNVYAYIGERVGFKPVSGLGLIYYEPLTDIDVAQIDSLVLGYGFSMQFSGHVLQLDLRPDRVPTLLKRIREIYDLPQMPEGVEGCRDCQLMQVMTNVDPMTNLIKHGREERFLEYKASAPWDDLKQKIAKTAMGMANIKGGGTILIGVVKRGERYVPEGVLEQHQVTYATDDVQRYVNRFADPYVRAELQEVKWNDKKFLALVVHEFEQLPVICKRDCDRLMRQGAIYTRSYQMPETCEVRSQNEMREIVEMGVEKGIVNFARSARYTSLPPPHGEKR